MPEESSHRLTDRLGFRLGLVLSIALLPVGLIAVQQAVNVLNEVRARSDTALMGETLRAAAPETRLIRQAQGAVAAVSSAAAAVLAMPEHCEALLKGLIAPGSPYSGAAFVGMDGAVRCVFPETAAPLFADLPVSTMQRDPIAVLNVSGDIQPSSGRGLIASHPVFDGAGALGGFLAVSIPSVVFETAADALEPKSDLAIVIFNGSGQVIAANEPLDGLRRLFPRDRDLGSLANANSGTFTAVAVSGDQRAFSVVPLVDPGLFALGSWPAREASIPGLPGLPAAAFPALMWLVSLVAAYLAAEMLVTRHIRDLRGAIMRFASGNRSVGPLDMRSAPREIRDVSEAFVQMTDTILRDEADLEHALHQKEALLREVHHRVKNNLQLIASIISMQMRETRSSEARQLMRAVQDRVISLATVHKDLYLTSHLTEIRADELLPQIVNQVINLAEVPDTSIAIETTFDPIELTPEQAVPLALLVAEAVTQARNEAAGDGGLSEVSVTLRRDGPDHAILSVTHAIEASALVAPGETMRAGLGRQLIDAFALQLGGDVSFDETRGNHRLDLRFALLDAPAAPDDVL